MAKLKLAVIVGSTRKGSINQSLAEALVKLGADSFDATFLKIDDLPMYNQDLEASAYPASATRLKQEIAAADAVLVVTPEYNRSIPALLKNAIDWAGRPYGKGVWSDKSIAITGASGGTIATAIAQQELRLVLSAQNANVLGSAVFFQHKPDLIDADHNVTDEASRGFLKGFVDRFAAFAGKLKG